MFRDQLPNLSNIAGTVFVFFVVIYFEGFKVTLKMANRKATSDAARYFGVLHTNRVACFAQYTTIKNGIKSLLSFIVAHVDTIVAIILHFQDIPFC